MTEQPMGTPATEGAAARAAASSTYRLADAEYAVIFRLRERDPAAAQELALRMETRGSLLAALEAEDLEQLGAVLGDFVAHARTVLRDGDRRTIAGADADAARLARLLRVGGQAELAEDLDALSGELERRYLALLGPRIVAASPSRRSKSWRGSSGPRY